MVLGKILFDGNLGNDCNPCIYSRMGTFLRLLRSEPFYRDFMIVFQLLHVENSCEFHKKKEFVS